jgi:alpha-tubulin suppressor-like RCC1 family protein
MFAICKPVSGKKADKEESLFAWGSNEKGQLGIGSNNKVQVTPR